MARVKSDHQLTFVWADLEATELEQDPATVLERVLAAWPGAEPPQVRRVALDVWFSELIEGEPAGTRAAPALVVCSDSEPRGLARALVDRMHQLQIPGVLLRPGCAEAEHLAGS